MGETVDRVEVRLAVVHRELVEVRIGAWTPEWRFACGSM